MNFMNVLLQAGAPGQGQSNWTMWLMMGAMFLIIYFFMIRPQNKKQKEIANFRKSLQVNQDVVTAGGIHGTIKHIEGDIVELQIANNVKINIEINSIFANPAAAAADKK